MSNVMQIQIKISDFAISDDNLILRYIFFLISTFCFLWLNMLNHMWLINIIVCFWYNVNNILCITIEKVALYLPYRKLLALKIKTYF